MPISYMIAYHSIPLIFTVKKQLKGKLRSRNEVFSFKIGGARLLIYLIFSLPIYFTNNITNALISSFIGADQNNIGYFKTYSVYFMFSAVYIMTVLISVLLTTFVFAKTGLLMKSDFPRSESKKNSALTEIGQIKGNMILSTQSSLL